MGMNPTYHFGFGIALSPTESGHPDYDTLRKRVLNAYEADNPDFDLHMAYNGGGLFNLVDPQEASHNEVVLFLSAYHLYRDKWEYTPPQAFPTEPPDPTPLYEFCARFNLTPVDKPVWRYTVCVN